ncbi:hypothetical protein CBS101457_006427 [Exobasidium rhododendri]|nr:hypothetical protein CBS101457_006427 [Exobasidium rhododendri]
MSTHASTKILTIGPPSGRVRELSTKIKAINDKYGPFEALLCLGDLFTPYDREGAELSQDESDLLDGTLKLPIPLYFALSASPLHPRLQRIVLERRKAKEDEAPIEIASKVFFLGGNRVYEIPSGLRIAVAGHWNADRYSEGSGKERTAVEDLLSPFLTPNSVENLLSTFQMASPVTESDEPAQSLAAARAQMAARTQALQQDQIRRPAVDILLTTNWATGITMFSDPERLPHPSSRMWGAPPMAQIARLLQPRYLFSLAPGSTSDSDLSTAGLYGSENEDDLRSTGVFWEREPYRNEQPPPSHPFCSTTRFISLARFANAKKQRWFMALNLAPAQKVSLEEAKASTSKSLTGATPSPFSSSGYGGDGGAADASTKRKTVEEEMDDGPNFRWSGNASRGKKPRGQGLPSRPNGPLPDRVREKRPLAIPVGPQDCWFCLSNPQCAKHLIVAIGTECYVAMPKGQLPTTSDPLSPVPGGGHVLIIPIEHFPSLLGHPDPTIATPIQKEMQSWRDALRKLYLSFDAHPFSWEVCKTMGTRAGHMQSQVIPIPKSQFAGLEDYFREAAKKWEYDFIEDQDEVRKLLQISKDQNDRVLRCDYVRIDFNDRTWIMLLKDRRFYLQFPRETLASYLSVPNRADWKACARSEGIETAEAKAFKSAFEDFSKGVGED